MRSEYSNGEPELIIKLANDGSPLEEIVKKVNETYGRNRTLGGIAQLLLKMSKIFTSL